jgi:hypothetical protein
VTLPALMLNGTLDNVFSYEEGQKPLLRMLGAPEADKRHVYSERGHANQTLSDAEIAEILAWLDKRLGAVKQAERAGAAWTALRPIPIE